MNARGPEDVLDFWLDEVGPDGWYAGGEALDAAVRDRFLPAWEAGVAGTLTPWLSTPRGALALVILLDQFPRNMFRDTARAFASDGLAGATAKAVIGRDWDLRIPEPERQFLFLPLMHSETLLDQDRCVRLFAARMPLTGAEQLLHARAHRDQIRRFGRFPGRNEALGRASTADEAAFLAEGGYAALVARMREAR